MQFNSDVPVLPNKDQFTYGVVTGKGKKADDSSSFSLWSFDNDKSFDHFYKSVTTYGVHTVWWWWCHSRRLWRCNNGDICDNGPIWRGLRECPVEENWWWWLLTCEHWRNQSHCQSHKKKSYHNNLISHQANRRVCSPPSASVITFHIKLSGQCVQHDSLRCCRRNTSFTWNFLELTNMQKQDAEEDNMLQIQWQWCFEAHIEEWQE